MRSAARLTRIGRLPLRWRLTLVSFGLLVLLLTALGAYVSITEEQTLLTNQAQTLHQEIHLASAPLKNAGIVLARPGQIFPVRGTIPAQALTPLAIMTNRLTGADIRAVVLDPAGTTILVGEDAQEAPASVSISQASLGSALAVTPTTDAYNLARGSNGRRQLIVLIPLVNSATHAIVGVLQVSAPVTPIEDAIAQMRLTLMIGVLVTLVIAAALTLPLITAALRPLNAVARASRDIAERASQGTPGALAVRLDTPPTHDEIGRLTDSFNTMVAQLDTMFTRQKQFAADASHELRTPLTAVSSGLEMLMLGADQGDPDAARRLLRGMYREVQRLQRLVQDLLTLSRLDDGHVPLRIQQVPVGPLLADLCEQAERLAHGQRVRTDIPSAIPALSGDPDRMSQVLFILVDNALKHTPTGGTITLAASATTLAERPAVTLSVRDTGTGIPPEALPHVFERFYRGDAARAHTAPPRSTSAPGQRVHRGSGAGLGLSIASQLIQAQGGLIAIESTPGRGTTVAVTLPAYAADDDAEDAEMEQAEAANEPMTSADG